jgi:hypothetical protein
VERLFCPRSALPRRCEQQWFLRHPIFPPPNPGNFLAVQDLTEAVRQDADAKLVCCHATGERRHLYGNDRRSGHLSDEKVGNHGARRLEHTAQPIRIAMQRQRLAEWDQCI